MTERSRSRSFVAEDDVEVEIERQIEMRGRTRSSSFRHDPDDHEDNGYGRARSHSIMSEDDGSESYGRGRSHSIVSEDGDTDTGSGDIAMKAANLSKIYLAGGKPVNPNSLPPPKHGATRKSRPMNEALTEKALNALNIGLRGTGNGPPRDANRMTEEEEEEMKLAEEEAKKLSSEKNAIKAPTSATASSTAKAAFSSFASSFTKGVTGRLRIPLSGRNSTSGSDAAEVSGSDQSAKSQPTKKKHKLKLLMLGDSGVGKSSLIRVISGDQFSESMIATAGVDFKLREMEIEGEQVAMQIWDTAGQERFHRITAAYYKGANGIILVYDVTDREGFDNVGYWMDNIKQYSSPHLPAMLLVGNKIDLTNRTVTPEEGRAEAAKYHCRFLETSAKTSENVEDAIRTVAGDALFLSFKPGMTQRELLEKEKIYGARRMKAENCAIS